MEAEDVSNTQARLEVAFGHHYALLSQMEAMLIQNPKKIL